ncbi:MAG TPA: aspartate kinase, partial [Candidatus Acetothermia bacterium]|nr:aspartate kinase [Candidatus Acetothermia bacterium]
MSTLVMKFGGTSVGDVSAFAQVRNIVSEHVRAGDRVIPVVSAMSGVTDALSQGITSAAHGDENAYREASGFVRKRHLSAMEGLITDPAARARIVATIDE